MTKGFVSEEFDRYAAEYDAALAQGINVSGEDKIYFASGRVAWLSSCLNRQRFEPQAAMDFGCGTGSAAPFLFDLIKIKSLVGVDVSPASLEVARRASDLGDAQFLLFNQYEPASQIDLAFCNGVFHHIPVADRAGAIDYVYRSLKPGGYFALWENNPWNPGTRYVMSRIPFDRDAITLSAPETRRLCSARGFEILRTDFLFIFPALLGWLRGIEPLVSRLPLGAQYQVLCRKRS
jgi:SAM-dependent methyltransferase